VASPPEIFCEVFASTETDNHQRFLEVAPGGRQLWVAALVTRKWVSVMMLQMALRQDELLIADPKSTT
jgi:hypothetical protein